MVLKLLFATFFLALFFEVNYSDALSCLPCNKSNCKKPVFCKGKGYTFLVIKTLAGCKYHIADSKSYILTHNNVTNLKQYRIGCPLYNRNFFS